MRTIRIATALGALLSVAPLGVVFADAAHAVTPPCNSYTRVHFSGDPAEYGTDEDIYQDIPSVGFGTGDFGCVLKPGASNYAVYVLREALTHCYDGGPGEGRIYDDATEESVWAAQRDAGITADGIYGPKTGENMFFPTFDADSQFLACTRFGDNY